MQTEQVMKKKLINKIEKLRIEYIKELLDFAKFLVTKQEHEKETAKVLKIKGRNPLLELIGSANKCDGLAENIDEELYDKY